MRVVLAGNNDGPLILARAMRSAEMEPVCVALQKEPDADLRAAHREAKLEFCRAASEDELARVVKEREGDIVVNAFATFRYDALLSALPVLNVHLAPLPRYRGRHPLQWALINGEERFGVTIHEVTAGWDAGPILWQAEVEVDRGMSVRELRSRLMDEVGAAFAEVLIAYGRGTISCAPNRDEEATYVARRRPEDSRLTEWHSRETILRKVLALRSESYPAYLQVGGDRIVTRFAAAGRRRYVGLAAPFITSVTGSAIEIACLDGQTVLLQKLDPPRHSLRVNDRIG